MRKSHIFITLLCMALVPWISAAQKDRTDITTAEAIKTIYDLGITKYDTINTYMPENFIRRDEVSAMMFRFASAFGKLAQNYVANSNCNFVDINEAHADLQDAIQSSCYNGLFKGYNNHFYPRSQFTNAQAVTVLARIFRGQQDEVNVAHRADNYLNLLYNMGLTSWMNLKYKSNYDLAITRWDVAILLARGYQRYLQNQGGDVHQQQQPTDMWSATAHANNSKWVYQNSNVWFSFEYPVNQSMKIDANFDSYDRIQNYITSDGSENSQLKAWDYYIEVFQENISSDNTCSARMTITSSDTKDGVKVYWTHHAVNAVQKNEVCFEKGWKLLYINYNDNGDLYFQDLRESLKFYSDASR